MLYSIPTESSAYKQSTVHHAEVGREDQGEHHGIQYRTSLFHWQCDYHSKKWSELSSCPETDYALVVINNLLTTVGGRHNFNKLFSFCTTPEGNWVERFPPMPHGRVCPAAVCTGPALIVTSGSNEHSEAQYTVDVMDTSTLQWFPQQQAFHGKLVSHQWPPFVEIHYTFWGELRYG